MDGKKFSTGPYRLSHAFFRAPAISPGGTARTSTFFSGAVAPEMMVNLLLGKEKMEERSEITAWFAFPPTGGAVTWHPMLFLQGL
jgi:hypothetical protein